MKIVLNTNVLVSGLLTPFGPGGEIVRMVTANRLTLYMDARILSEYEEVLSRPKFQFSKERIDVVIGHVKQRGVFVSSVPLQNHLPDLDDEPFLEVAIAGNVRSLVTGNKAHYPSEITEGVRTLSPSEFLHFYTEDKSTEPADSLDPRS